jgi:integrase
MKGTVIKRGKKWSVIIDVGRDENGKRIRRWHSGFDRKREAEEARIEILSRLQLGSYTEPTKATVTEFLLHQWLPAKKPTVEATTFAAYRSDVETKLVPAFGTRKLQQLTPAEINGLYADLAARGLAAKTIRNVHAVLHKALGDAARWGLVNRNVADLADPPKAVRPEIRTWTASEVRSFLASTTEDRLSAMWVVMASTGMRRSEVLGLRWPSVDLEARRLAVVDTVVNIDSQATLRLRETKTAGSRRTVALDAATTTVLRSHRTRQIAERLKAGTAWRNDHDLVFSREDGTLLPPNWVTRTFQRTAREQGLEPIGPHGLRHSWATLALQAGVPAKVVSERLGHSSVGITLDRYSHVLPTMQEDAAETVGQILFGQA